MQPHTRLISKYAGAGAVVVPVEQPWDTEVVQSKIVDLGLDYSG